MHAHFPLIFFHLSENTFFVCRESKTWYQIVTFPLMFNVSWLIFLIDVNGNHDSFNTAGCIVTLPLQLLTFDSSLWPSEYLMDLWSACTILWSILNCFYPSIVCWTDLIALTPLTVLISYIVWTINPEVTSYINATAHLSSDCSGCLRLSQKITKLKGWQMSDLQALPDLRGWVTPGLTSHGRLRNSCQQNHPSELEPPIVRPMHEEYPWSRLGAKPKALICSVLDCHPKW